MPAAHDPVLDEDLYDAAQHTRAANRLGAAKVRTTARRYSLSGLAVCGHCGGPMHFHLRAGKPAVYCYQKRQSGARPCDQREQLLDGIEAQVGAYLATFHLPDEEVDRIIRLHAEASQQHDDSERRRREIGSRLERIAELYKWGDMTREAYRGEREQLERALGELKGTSTKADLLAKTAAFLRDLPAAWAIADADQRNSLARLVFQAVQVTDDRATAIVPQPDFAPFFVAASGNDESPDSSCQGSGLTSGSDGIRYRSCRPGYLPFSPCGRASAVPASGSGRYAAPRSMIPPERWPEVREHADRHGLRAAARVFGVSHAAVRQIVARSATAGAG